MRNGNRISSRDQIILTAGDAYLKATFKERDAIRGKPLFEVYPDNPALPESDATANLGASLQWVLARKRPHQMALQRYDVSRTDDQGGFAEKYRLPSNTPVLDGEGQVHYIVHRVEDRTEQVQSQKRLEALNRETSSRLKDSQDREKIAVADAQVQRNWLAAFVEQAPVGIALFLGTQHRIELANRAVCELWGRTPPQVLGKPLFEAVPEVSGRGFGQLLDRVMLTGEPCHSQELPGR